MIKWFWRLKEPYRLQHAASAHGHWASGCKASTKDKASPLRVITSIFPLRDIFWHQDSLARVSEILNNSAFITSFGLLNWIMPTDNELLKAFTTRWCPNANTINTSYDELGMSFGLSAFRSSVICMTNSFLITASSWIRSSPMLSDFSFKNGRTYQKEKKGWSILMGEGFHGRSVILFVKEYWFTTKARKVHEAKKFET